MSFPELTGNRIAAHSRHVYIRDHHIRPQKATEGKNFITAQYGVNFVTFLGKDRRERHGGVAVIISDHDPQPMARCWVGGLTSYKAKWWHRGKLHRPPWMGLNQVHAA